MTYCTKIPPELIRYILEYTGNTCHTCNKQITLDFYLKQSKYYYCSKDCYNFV